MNAIIGKVTPIMIAKISYGTFFFYGACCVVMGAIVLFFLPETKGRTLEEMDEVTPKRSSVKVTNKSFADFRKWQCYCYLSKAQEKTNSSFS